VHRDKNGDPASDALFAKVNLAYEKLMDPVE